MQESSIFRCCQPYHDRESALYLCIKPECKLQPVCCKLCIKEQHKNHQFEEMISINEIDNTESLQLSQSYTLIQQLENRIKNTLKMMISFLQKIDLLKQLQEKPSIQVLKDISQIIKSKRNYQQIQNKLNDHSEKIYFHLEQMNDFIKGFQQNNQNASQIDSHLDLENTQFNPAPTLLPGHSQCITSVAISDDQKYIASGGFYEVFLWDLQSKENVKKYKGPQYVYHLSFSRDNKRLAAAGEGYKSCDIFIFDIADLKRNDPIQLLKGHTNGIYRTVFTKNSKNLISGSWDKTLRVWDVDGQKEIANKKCANGVYGVAISNNEELIGCCCNGGLAYLFESTTLNMLNEKIPPWQAHPSRTNCIEFIQDSSVLLTSGATEIRLWSVQDLLQKKTQHIKEIKSGENNQFRTVKAYPVSNPKVIVGCDGKIKIWKLEDAQLKQTIEVQGGLYKNVGKQFALTSDFKKIITGGEDKSVKIYEYV